MSVFKKENNFDNNVVFDKGKNVYARIVFGSLSNNIYMSGKKIGYKLKREHNGCGYKISLALHSAAKQGEVEIISSGWMEDEATCYIDEKEDYVDIEIKYRTILNVLDKQ